MPLASFFFSFRLKKSDTIIAGLVTPRRTMALRCLPMAAAALKGDANHVAVRSPPSMNISIPSIRIEAAEREPGVLLQEVDTAGNRKGSSGRTIDTQYGEMQGEEASRMQALLSSTSTCSSRVLTSTTTNSFRTLLEEGSAGEALCQHYWEGVHQLLLDMASVLPPPVAAEREPPGGTQQHRRETLMEMQLGILAAVEGWCGPLLRLLRPSTSRRQATGLPEKEGNANDTGGIIAATAAASCSIGNRCTYDGRDHCCGESNERTRTRMVAGAAVEAAVAALEAFFNSVAMQRARIESALSTPFSVDPSSPTTTVVFREGGHTWVPVAPKTAAPPPASNGRPQPSVLNHHLFVGDHAATTMQDSTNSRESCLESPMESSMAPKGPQLFATPQPPPALSAAVATNSDTTQPSVSAVSGGSQQQLLMVCQIPWRAHRRGSGGAAVRRSSFESLRSSESVSLPIVSSFQPPPVSLQPPSPTTAQPPPLHNGKPSSSSAVGASPAAFVFPTSPLVTFSITCSSPAQPHLMTMSQNSQSQHGSQHATQRIASHGNSEARTTSLTRLQWGGGGGGGGFLTAANATHQRGMSPIATHTNTANTAHSNGAVNGERRSSTMGASHMAASILSLLYAPELVTTNKLVRSEDDVGMKMINDYVMLQTLGEGACGKVKLAHSVERGMNVAIKIVRRRRGMGGEGARVEALRQEIAVMKKLRHKNIVSLYEVIDDPEAEKMYLVMQYIDRGSIGTCDLVQGEEGSRIACTRIAPAKLAEYARQMAAGLEYLHRHGVAHRDLKPENILLSSDDQAFLADFSAACAASDDGSGYAGTPLFMAPEVVTSTGAQLDSDALAASDMWSLGVTLFALLLGRLPFDSVAVIEGLLNHRSNAVEDVIWSVEDPAWRALVRSLLNVDPKLRPTAKACRRVIKQTLLPSTPPVAVLDTIQSTACGSSDADPERTDGAPPHLRRAMALLQVNSDDLRDALASTFICGDAHLNVEVIDRDMAPDDAVAEMEEGTCGGCSAAPDAVGDEVVLPRIPSRSRDSNKDSTKLLAPSTASSLATSAATHQRVSDASDVSTLMEDLQDVIRMDQLHPTEPAAVANPLLPVGVATRRKRNSNDGEKDTNRSQQSTTYRNVSSASIGGDAGNECGNTAGGAALSVARQLRNGWRGQDQ